MRSCIWSLGSLFPPSFQMHSIKSNICYADIPCLCIDSFFKAPYYDLATARFVEDHKTGFAAVEALTLEIGPPQFPHPMFTGPVLLTTGEYDFIACDG